MPKVTIVVLTYNHEKFIVHCLQSVLNQQVDFEYEILVMEDGSTDQTKRLVSELSKLNPQIKLLSSFKNKGIRNNVFKAIDNLKSEYLAVLDGDDFWCENTKLNTQIKFLDENPDFVGNFHDASIINDVLVGNQYFEIQKLYSQRYYYKNITYSPDFIDRSFIIPSSSLVIRTESLKQMNFDLFQDNLSIAWKLLVMTTRGSKLKYFNEAWSVYRNHDTGISKSKKEKFHLSHIQFLENLLKEKNFKEYLLEIYNGILSEIKILLENKNETNLYSKKKLLRKHLRFEMKRIWAYRKRIFKK